MIKIIKMIKKQTCIRFTRNIISPKRQNHWTQHLMRRIFHPISINHLDPIIQLERRTQRCAHNFRIF